MSTYLILAAVTYGYVLGKLPEKTGLLKSLILCVCISAVWPAYWGYATYACFRSEA